MTDLVLVIFSAALLNDFVLSRPLGIDPALAVERRQVHALGLATLALMLFVGVCAQALWQWALVPLHLESLRLLVFLPLSVLCVAPLLKLLARRLPTLPFDGLWPLMLGNAGILGLTLINAQADKGLFHATASSLGAGLGFWLVLSLFSDLRERTAGNDIPLPFRGLPIRLIGAGLMAVAFLGFSGLIKT
ncbi:NADH:quinone oxidoreductase [Pseudomonas sp. COR58]|uniref:NADH:quinone oxidoreductase n=1 Tax=Pseudomonas ekonensis TaxID=2842353 RepID=A0ABS6P8X8_9PSED|nr:Rnf-Nqr domain containing protein [Pseudomonas ekonensis]MBV4456930.1 NADH:quinone oxidoreductase [Pseudomonas ekonensis]